MKLLTWVREKLRVAKSPADIKRLNSRTTETQPTSIIRIHVISGYLKLIGMKVKIFYLPKIGQGYIVTTTGIVHDLSDNGQALILTDVEHLWNDNHVVNQNRCNVALIDFDMIEILDKRGHI